MVKLRMVPITPHPWRFHKWEKVEGLVDNWGLVYQCRKCALVEVHDVLLDEVWTAPPEALKPVDRSPQTWTP